MLHILTYAFLHNIIFRKMSFAVDIAVIIAMILIGVGFGFAYKQWEAGRATRMAQVILKLAAQWDKYWTKGKPSQDKRECREIKAGHRGSTCE